MIDFGIVIPNEIQCLPNSMYVEKIEFGERQLKSGLYVPQEHMDYQGRFVRPRWAKVKYKADNINYINVGDWCLIKHGNWSLSMLMTIKGVEQKLWYISLKSLKEGVMAISHTMPEELKEYGIKDES